MRKLVSALILICMLFISVPQTSFALKEKIMFRDVPWGVSALKVKESFADPIYWDLPETEESCFGMDYWTTGDGRLYSGNVCETIKSSLSRLNPINVAGLDASMVVLRFANRGESLSPAFVMGEYLFAKGDASDVYMELLGKLGSLYGRNHESSAKISTEFDFYSVWKDKEGNAISLCQHGQQLVSLRYISGQMDELFAEAEAQNVSVKQSNYDGL